MATYKEYYERLEQRLKYLQKVILDFRMRQLALLNKDQEYFQYSGGDLVYLISPLTGQLRIASCCVIQNSYKRIISILV